MLLRDILDLFHLVQFYPINLSIPLPVRSTKSNVQSSFLPTIKCIKHFFEKQRGTNFLLNSGCFDGALSLTRKCKIVINSKF